MKTVVDCSSAEMKAFSRLTFLKFNFLSKENITFMGLYKVYTFRHFPYKCVNSPPLFLRNFDTACIFNYEQLDAQLLNFDLKTLKRQISHP